MPRCPAPLLLLASPAGHLRTPDLVLIAAYLIAITLFGLSFRSKDGPGSRSLKNYFLAGNTVPWWAIALSVVSAETSTLTIISIPGVAFTGNLGFLQVVIGYLAGRVVVAFLFLPRYLAGNMLTAYQLIDQRFGPVLHKITAGLFLLTRAAAEGVRVFAVSIVVSIAIGTGDVLSIALISGLTLLYTFEGGLAAVIWTDVVQMGIYVAGTVVALVSLGHHVPGGWPAIGRIAGAAGKFHTFNFALNLTQSYTFWAGLLGGTFLTMASHGTDQLMVQRLLAARNLRQSQLALLSSGVVIFFQFAFFLLIGAGLWVFYGGSTNPHAAAAFRTTDYIFPTFITHEMPTGIAGLLVAAILAAAMSNLSAALNSLSSTTVVDFYLRLRPDSTDRQRNLISKSSTALWALVLFAIALVALHNGGKGHVVEIGLSIAAVAYGCLLGVFLLGTLTHFATEKGTILGMITGFALNLWLWQGSFPKVLFQGAQDTPRKLADGTILRTYFLPPITISHIAFTWYVLIGALVTFTIGALASLVLRRLQPRPALIAPCLLTTVLLSNTKDPGILHVQTNLPNQANIPTASADEPSRPLRAILLCPLLLLSFLSFPKGICCLQAQAQRPSSQAPTPDFSPVDQLITDAIARRQLPGAVIVVGHSGHIAYQHAYGNRKLAGEPGLDGTLSPAEPMTEDTIFDMASLTKVIVTTTAISQLYEQGKLDFDAPLEHYLPDFNPTHDPERNKVNLRLMLTHFSGEPPDVNLKDGWGLAAPDRAEGLHRALTTPLANRPGTKMVYSDINFILLGHLVEVLSGERLDAYAHEHIFQPLGLLTSSYHAFDRACGPHHLLGAAISPDLQSGSTNQALCSMNTWPVMGFITAPTAHDDEGTPATNPDFNYLLRGTVHDPTGRRMGGVAGHAGLFSTAHDMSLFAQAFLDRYAGRPSNFPLKRETLLLMTQPQQPGHTPEQLADHRRAESAAEAAGEKPATGDPTLLSPNYPAIKDQPLRGYGWDIDSGYSKPRGRLFPIGSFGHTGFTGTSLWLDPASDTYVLLLSNAIHPKVGPAISNLRGEVATAAALALGLGSASSAPNQGARVQTGVDVLESTHFAALAPLAQAGQPLRLALLTNQTGLDHAGRRTVDILFIDLPKALPQARLTTLFSPEHGIFGRQDTEHLAGESDPSTGLQVTSLYGPHESDRRPTHSQLQNLDAVVIDLQDVGVRCYTYETVVGYFLEAAAAEHTQFHHLLHIVLLDRPNPLGGVTVAGPTSDPGTESYVNYQAVPLQHGLTLGELARYIVANRHLDALLTVVPLQNWSRNQLFPDTGLPWTAPSPNLRTPTAALLYPATAMLELTNLSVGRGSPIAFEVFGAPTPASGPSWFNAEAVAAALNDQHLPGVHFQAIQLAIPEDKNRYPGHGQTLPAVHILLEDGSSARTLHAPAIGVALLSTLHRLYPTEFQFDRAMRIIASRSTLNAVLAGEPPAAIAAGWQASLDAFWQARQTSLLY